MKKNNILILLMIIPIFLLFSSCDELNKLDLNMPVIIEFSPHGTNTTVTEDQYFCLSDYKDWRDNQGDIESAKYVTASYWTLAGSSPGLSGNITFTLYDGVGTLIFSVPMGNITVDTYLDAPLELTLTLDQIDALNNVLSTMSDDGCFKANLTITNIDGQKINGEFNLNGKVEIVLELAVNAG